MKTILPESAIRQLFTEARSYHAWKERPVSDVLLKSIYEIMKWGPTAVNANPARIIFVKSETEKDKLLPALMGSNVGQVKSAPVTAIIAFDEKFFNYLPDLFPAFDAKSMFENNKEMSSDLAFRNSSLQGAYFMIAARAMGLDVCPMSGFDNKKVDEAFLAGTSWKSNFICTLGYGSDEGLYPRGPRLEFDEVCKIL